MRSFESLTEREILALAIASLAAVVPLGPGTTVAQVPLGSLKTVPVPKPDLAGFVRDEATAIKLGKWARQLYLDLGMELGLGSGFTDTRVRLAGQLPKHQGQRGGVADASEPADRSLADGSQRLLVTGVGGQDALE